MGFDLANVLKDVSELDTFRVETREQIEYINIDLIDSDPANFYEISAIDELAGNIETIGLQQPIRVRENPGDPTHVIIVSGHRRRAAMAKLVADGREDLREIPCIREKQTGSYALQELKVIYANSDTRRMSSADISKQAERIEQLLYQLKNEGYEFPGRMRDHVAEVCKISQSKLARLKVIRDNLHDCWDEHYQKNLLSEAAAYALAQMPKNFQSIIYSGLIAKKQNLRWVYENDIKSYGSKLKKVSDSKCEKNKGSLCSNIGRKCDHVIYASIFETLHCDKCCGVCPELGTCRHACPNFAEKINKIKADKKEARRQERLAKEEAERPFVEKIHAIWQRFSTARQQSGKSVKEYYKAADMYYSKESDEKISALEACTANTDRYTSLPFGYNFSLSDAERLIHIADLFGCSIDYLFCRTDVPNRNQNAAVPASWFPGKETPTEPVDAVARFRVEGKDTPMTIVARWNGMQWVFGSNRATIDAECVSWIPLPPDETEGS